jgi:hypothetical protein
MPDMYEIVDAGFERAADAGDGTVMWRHPLPDGREASVRDARLCLAAPGAPEGRDVYRYPTPMAAVMAAAKWIEDDCRREPEGWTKDLGTGRVTADTRDDARDTGDTAWVCPRHKDRLATMNRGRLFCRLCGRPLDDAIRVPWPPPGTPK